MACRAHGRARICASAFPHTPAPALLDLVPPFSAKRHPPVPHPTTRDPPTRHPHRPALFVTCQACHVFVAADALKHVAAQHVGVDNGLKPHADAPCDELTFFYGKYDDPMIDLQVAARQAGLALAPSALPAASTSTAACLLAATPRDARRRSAR